MRFRYMEFNDITEAARLWAEMHHEAAPEELHYPITDDKSAGDFSVSLARQLLGNQAWFAICGVVGSKIEEDAQGVKHVVGGKVKAYIAVSMTERTIGYPRNVAFIELLVVDKQCRKKDIGRKLVHLMAVEASQRGANVIEGAWNPGSLGEKLWPGYGLRPYRVLGAYVLEDGTPRTDLPMPRKPVEPTDQPKKRRGRPPKAAQEGT